MKRIDDYSVHDDLPESLNRQNAKELAELWDKAQLKFIDSQIHKILIYPVIDQLDSELVDELAIQLHCDFYDKSLSIEARRNIVKTSIAWHRIKGTPAAVEMLTQNIFRNSYTKEWFEYGGRPYFFRMVQDISDGREDVTPETLAQLKKAIWMGKNVRSWLELLEFFLRLEDTPEYSEEIAVIKLLTGFEDYYPYRGISPPQKFDGANVFGSPFYADGKFLFDGSMLYDGIIPGALMYGGGIRVEIDSLQLGGRIVFRDDVSLRRLLYDGGAVFDGGNAYDGEEHLPADKNIFLGQRMMLNDKIPPPTHQDRTKVQTAIADIYTFGCGKIPVFDGKEVFAKGFYAEGHYIFDGNMLYDGIIHDVVPEAGDKTALDHDHLHLGGRIAFRDDVSLRRLLFDGEEDFTGGSDYGGTTNLPMDKGQRSIISLAVVDDAKTKDAGAKLTITHTPSFAGDFFFDGQLPAGGFTYEDDSTLRILDCSGAFSFDGAAEFAADGRLMQL